MKEMITVLGLSLLFKNTPANLGHHLTHQEFQCQCNHPTCHYTLVSPLLVMSWNNLRKSWDRPLKINSGFRCQIHNSSDHVKGKDHSRHTMGLAVDISTRDLTDGERWGLREEAEKYFDVVIDYGTFLHCHIEPKELKH